MKKSSFLALAVAPMILGAPLASQAQSVSTDPVGFVKTELTSEDYTLISVNLTKPSVYGASVSSATSDSIVVSDDNVDFSTVLGDGIYYIEVTSGLFKGDRLDIESASDQTLNLDLSAGHNTVDTAEGVEAGSTFVIREHYTFADLAESIGIDSLLKGNGPDDSDQILTFESGGFVSYFLGSDENWYSSDGSFTNVNGKAIPTGSGVLFYANPVAGERDLNLLVLGEVRNNDVVLPTNEGYQIITTGFPIDMSPSDLLMNTDYFEGGSGTEDADLILRYQDGGFVSYFLGSDDNWYTTDGSFTVVTDDKLFKADEGVLLYRQSADPDFRINNQL